MKAKSYWSRILLTGASLAAMGAFSPTLAQDEEASDEIVVTATGRTAALQDVPVAVTAIGGDQIENTGANDLRDLTQVAPSFNMGTGQSNSSGTTARIRGIGTGSDNPGFEAAVGIFIDGVYRARAGAALADLPELERVEILRGPQGTLFGRNTSAGAISVVTAGPDFAPGMSLEGTFGFDDLEEVGTRAMVNVPVGDTFALRVDGSIRARDGYITDLISNEDINDRNRWTARAQALWDISPDASLRVIVDGGETNEVCCGITPLVYGSTQAAITAIVGPAGTPAINPENRGMTVTPGLGALPSLGPGLPAQPANGPRSYAEDTEELGMSAQLDWDIGGMNFTSITAYRDWDAVRDQDIDFNLIDIAYRDDLEVGFENLTQEFRLQGENGRLNWLVGLFYGDETLQQRDTIRVGQQSNFYANALARGGTTSLATPLGCELYDSSAAADPDTIPSFFYCASDNPATPLVFDPNVALANTYLTGNVSGQGQQNDRWQVETESLALFTHNEFSLSDQLVLTLGVRYNQETKDLSANLNSVSNSCSALQAVEIGTDAFFGGAADRVGFVQVLQGSPTASGLMNIACNPAINPIANGVWTGSSEEEEWSGTLSLAYHVSDDVMIYGGYSRGYKAGGFNVDRSGFSITPDLTALDLLANPNTLNVGQLAFAPEFTDSYEIGLRSTIFGNTTLNITGYYQEIHDYQLNAFNGFNFITRNIPEAISQGVELEVATRVSDALTLSGGVTYNDAYYDSTVVFNTLDPTPNTVVAGTPFSFAPEWVATAAIQYEMPLGGDMRALFYLDGRYNSEYRTQTLNRDPLGRTDNEAYAIFNGRIGIGPQDERWSVEFWGRNLTDEFYYVGAFVPPLQSGTFVVYPNEPQTYGVTVRARY